MRGMKFQDTRDVLTPVELEVLQQVADGKKYKQIAETLGVTKSRIANRMQTIREKTESHSTLEVVVSALRQSIID